MGSTVRTAGLSSIATDFALLAGCTSLVGGCLGVTVPRALCRFTSFWLRDIHINSRCFGHKVSDSLDIYSLHRQGLRGRVHDSQKLLNFTAKLVLDSPM